MPKLYPLNINHLHDSTIVKCLGRGSFGDVKLYKCKEKEKSQNGEMVECSRCFVVKQIKTLHKGFWETFIHKKEDDAKIKKILLNEYTIGSLLHHPNIRETLDIDLVDNCIIFEYCDGCDLFNYISNCKSSKSEFCFYFKQMLNAIEYIHNMGIAHMDLKLENIMIDTQNKVLKLIDFGQACVCKINGNNIKKSGIHGSEPYIAPEEFCEREYDPLKVDIWALGIILYELMYKKMPWKRAVKTDSNFVKYLNCFYNNNLVCVFPNLAENDPIFKVLIKTLDPDPLNRSNIVEIKNLFDQLCQLT
jgi:serine/threonine protein kinase